MPNPYYPTNIPTLTDIFFATDDITWMYQTNWDPIRKEVKALCDELGTLPKGAYGDVKTRLDTQAKLIKDTDGDTKVDTEESADEDKIRMDVKGVEAFLLDDTGVLTLVKNSGVRAYLGTTQENIVNGVVTKILLDSETYDIQNEFDPVTNRRFTAKVAGYYKINSSLTWDINTILADKRYNIYIKKSGATILISESSPSFTAQYLSQTCSDIVYLAANDYIELFCHQLSGVNTVDVVGHMNWTFLSIAKVR